MSHGQAHTVQDASGAGPAAPLRLRHLLPLTLVVGTCAVVYAATVVAGYLAAGPAVGTAAEGGTSPPVLPSGTSALLGYLAILLTPFASVVGALFVGIDVLYGPGAGRGWRDLLPSVAVLALCLVVLAAYVALGPLTSWWLD